MVNFSKLQNITQLTLDTSNFTSNTDLVPNMIEMANTSSDNYLGLGIGIVMFLVLVFALFRDDGDLRFDIARSILKASGLTLILQIGFIVVGITTTFKHVMWFAFIFIIAMLWIYFLKKKGL